MNLMPTRQWNIAESGLSPALFTLSRTTRANYFDRSLKLRIAEAHAPRIEYSPATGRCLGLVIEGAGTNMLPNSETIQNWAQSATNTASNSLVAPDEQTTGELMAETASTAEHFVSQTITVVPGQSYSISGFLRLGSREFGAIFVNTDIVYAVTINLITGGITKISGNPTNVSVSPVAGGWWFIKFSFLTVSATSALVRLYALADGTFNNRSYLGVITNNLGVFGVSMYNSSFPQSYFVTTTVAAARAAETYLISGSNFLSFWNTFEGSLTFHGSTGTDSSQRFLFCIDDATANNRIAVSITGSVLTFTIVTGSVTQATISVDIGYTSGGMVGVGISFRQNLMALSVNGLPTITELSIAIPTVTRLSLGNALSANYMYGYVAKLSYYNKAIPDYLPDFSAL